MIIHYNPLPLTKTFEECLPRSLRHPLGEKTRVLGGYIHGIWQSIGTYSSHTNIGFNLLKVPIQGRLHAGICRLQVRGAQFRFC